MTTISESKKKVHYVYKQHEYTLCGTNLTLRYKLAISENPNEITCKICMKIYNRDLK